MRGAVEWQISFLAWSYVAVNIRALMSSHTWPNSHSDPLRPGFPNPILFLWFAKSSSLIMNIVHFSKTSRQDFLKNSLVLPLLGNLLAIRAIIMKKLEIDILRRAQQKSWTYDFSNVCLGKGRGENDFTSLSAKYLMVAKLRLGLERGLWLES